MRGPLGGGGNTTNASGGGADAPRAARLSAASTARVRRIRRMLPCLVRVCFSKTLLIDAACQESTVHGQDDASHKTGGIGSQKDRCPYQFLPISKALRRRAHQELPAPRRSIQEFFVHWGTKYTRHDRIHTNSMASPFNGHGAGQRSKPGLAGAVSGDFVQRYER